MPRIMLKSTVLLIALAAAFFFPAAAHARQQHLTPFGYTVDVPEGWVFNSITGTESLSYTHESGEGIFQLLFLPAEGHASAKSLFSAAAAGIQAVGDSQPFSFDGRDAFFASMQFNAAGTEVKGFIVVVNEEQGWDVILMAYAFTESYEALKPMLLSCLDSFSLSQERRTPGPVSQFFYPFPGPKPKRYTLPIAGQTLEIVIDPAEADAAQTLIEREALVLVMASEAPLEIRNEAWRRFYRIIYRDNILRLYPVAAKIDAIPAVRYMDTTEFAKFLLDWIQDFSYSRTGSFADFLSPIRAILSMEGDCDSLGLVYVMLLKFFDIDAILMVSSEYSHSMAAVDTPGPGARFTYGGTSYLVAEMTEKVDLGLIDASMADPSGWVAVNF